LLQSLFVALYCAGFAALLKGPLRWYEEAALAKRFGQQWHDYAARVPAYWPRLLFKRARVL